MTSEPRVVRLVALNPDGFSLGLAYLEAALAARFGGRLRVEQRVHDLDRIHRREVDLAALATDITEGEPLLVGFSWYCWNHRLIRDLAWLVRGLAPGCHLVVGGPEASTVAEAELAAFPQGTVFIRGEGEGTLAAVVDQLIEGAPGPLPPGAARRCPDGLAYGPSVAAALATTAIASPVLAGTVREASTNWMPSYATTRGCVFSCSFCAWQDGFREREFNLDTVLRELDVLAGRNYERIWITDTIFGRNEARAIEILRRLQRWPTGTRFAVELHARYLSECLAAELAKVPLAWAAVGVQSLAPDVLKLTRRSPRTEELLTAVGRLYRALCDRSVIHLDIIFGLPKQSADDCFETVDVLLDAFPEATIFTGMFQVLAGTKFEVLREEPGWVVLPPEMDCEVAATPYLGAGDMARVRDLATGLDAYTVLRGEGPPWPVTAGRLAEYGRSLRGTAFAEHPLYGRRERFTPAQLGELRADA